MRSDSFCIYRAVYVRACESSSKTGMSSLLCGNSCLGRRISISSYIYIYIYNTQDISVQVKSKNLNWLVDRNIYSVLCILSDSQYI